MCEMEKANHNVESRRKRAGEKKCPRGLQHFNSPLMPEESVATIASSLLVELH